MRRWINVLPEAGQIVRVRSRQYLVEEVVPPPKPDEQTLIRMSCLEDDAQGEPLEVLWEKEVDAEPAGGASWKAVSQKGFDDPRRFAAYLHTLRWNCVTATDPRLFQAPLRAGIQIHAYQLEPLRKALLLPRVNLFIADDVGVGKTIEAGLILREMILRQKVRCAVIACPASVVLQWRDEMENRFGLQFVVYDREFVIARRRERGYGVNPWKTHSRFIISHSLLRDEAYAAPLRDWLGNRAPGSLLILDEAHNAAPATGSKYAVDSHLTHAVRELAPLFEHRLFLSATPHNGHSNSFAALLELLDPNRFCRGVPVRSEQQRDAIMVRRLKDDLRGIVGEIPERKVVQVDIKDLPVDAPDLALSRLLEEYADSREARLGAASKSVQAASALVITSLQKRLLSSIEAFARTLRVHRKGVERQAAKSGSERAKGVPVQAQLSLLVNPPGSDDDRAALSEGEVEQEEEAQVESVSAAVADASVLLAHERELLEEMTTIAEGAKGEADPRILWLVNWIDQNQCSIKTRRKSGAAPKWTDRRLLVFTEYADTKRYLEQQLRAAIAGTDDAEERIRTFHGGMDEEAREEVKRAFNTNPLRHPLRILIATDAAREGVNLQNHCADLVHFDLPWNPSKIEQRNGRIDRKLQRAPEVRCYYFYYAQRPEDRVLEALVEKTKTIQKELGSLSPVLERRLGNLFSKGIRHKDTVRIVRDILDQGAAKAERALVEEELESSRERKDQLRTQVERLRDLLEASKEHLQLDESRFRDAVCQSLEILGAETLHPIDGTGNWVFPALDRQAGADASWVETLDTLRVPRRRDQKPWEWRKEAAIRPVSFRALESLDDQVVHLHLEHRVARRLLGWFLSQGFAHDDLSRACACLTNDAIPRVILLGRLSLYGDHASRLHDEILAVAARWNEAATRKEPLRPYAGEVKSKAMVLLEASLADPSLHVVPDAVRERLSAGADRDVGELLPNLREQASALAEKAVERLQARGTKEAKDMTDIIERQRTRIEERLKMSQSPQLLMEFKDMPEDEKRQLDADRRHWQKRLADLKDEIAIEPDRIRDTYVVKAQRVEPIGLVYLWPVSG